ncbi:DUF5958 family protein [Streptomyces sp. NPDC085665]|uniref:DUF5958 family protein n=1 Tax=Streptomyces sp. NPDC085665 TaxID=3365735 RepID=UPI0037CD4159
MSPVRHGSARSGVKATANPSVMVCMDSPRYGFAALPADEHVKAFRVLVSVFSVADTRRRQRYCKGMRTRMTPLASPVRHRGGAR